MQNARVRIEPLGHFVCRSPTLPLFLHPPPSTIYPRHPSASHAENKSRYLPSMFNQTTNHLVRFAAGFQPPSNKERGRGGKKKRNKNKNGERSQNALDRNIERQVVRGYFGHENKRRAILQTDPPPSTPPYPLPQTPSPHPNPPPPPHPSLPPTPNVARL